MTKKSLSKIFLNADKKYIQIYLLDKLFDEYLKVNGSKNNASGLSFLLKRKIIFIILMIIKNFMNF